MGGAAILAAARAVTKEKALKTSQDLEFHGAAQALSSGQAIHAEAPQDLNSVFLGLLPPTRFGIRVQIQGQPWGGEETGGQNL